MVSAEEILKSLQDEMQKCSDEFKNINDMIEKTTQEYNDNISQLLTRKEQIRGTYTGLYNQYQKFVGAETNNIVPEVKDEPATPIKDEQPIEVEKETNIKESKKETPKTVKQTTKAGLTPEERAKLKQVTTKKTDAKGNEIPEYLQDSYQ